MSTSSNPNPGSRSSIPSLPLAPSVPHFLKPDPLFPSTDSLPTAPPASDEAKSTKTPPSYLRRARPVKEGAHFSYVTPLPIQFPYSLPEPLPTSEESSKHGNAEELKKVEGEEVMGEVSRGKKVDRVQESEEVVQNGVTEEKASKEAEKKKLDIEGYLSLLEPSLDWSVKDSEGKVMGYTSALRAAPSEGDPEVRKDLDDEIERLKGEYGLDFKSPFSKRVLLSLSKKCWDDCLASDKVSFPTTDKNLEIVTRFLSGEIVAYQPPSTPSTEVEPTLESKGWAPFSLCYGGHQFGQWAGQLGDGRAISILSTPFNQPSSSKLDPFTFLSSGSTPKQNVELQLKGSGRTPFSRFADGLAVLRSSIREFLGAEAMAALKIPTSRTLSLISLPDVKVLREKVEKAAIVCRVAPSWIRIGNFEIQRERQEWGSLYRLASYVSQNVLGLPPSSKSVEGVDDGGVELKPKGMAGRLLREVGKRNARMIAAWQVYGFMHGVMNTDNISVLGLTIDYGPYAFMDIYDPLHICNHSDDAGRYSYRMQPTMGVWAVKKLGEALAELIGAEESASSAAAAEELGEGWAEGKSVQDLGEWREDAGDFIDNVQKEYMKVFLDEYKELMIKRLGLIKLHETDFNDLFDPLLDLMKDHSLDYNLTFRLLCHYSTDPSPQPTEEFLSDLLPTSQDPTKYVPSRDEAVKQWSAWLSKYASRLKEQYETEGDDEVKRMERMKGVNPRFVLRQWVLEAVIESFKNSEDIEGGKQLLEKILGMCERPFEAYGERSDYKEGSRLPEEDGGVDDGRRFCRLGDERMLGFQCSCSS